ncbi:MAG: antibiotic biosynthesis monooxygenase [Actinomycetes bacterium]
MEPLLDGNGLQLGSAVGKAPDSVYLFVAIEVKPGKCDEFIEKIKVHGAHIRTEDGCETLEIFTDSQNMNRVCVWEVWTSRALWDAHMENVASTAWQKIAKEYVNSEKITVMKSI